jgi:hypothetical protein
LQKPFAANTMLAQAVDPKFPSNQIKHILNGTFLQQEEYILQLNPTQQVWVKELQQQIDATINTEITIYNFLHFFKK